MQERPLLIVSSIDLGVVLSVWLWLIVNSDDIESCDYAFVSSGESVDDPRAIHFGTGGMFDGRRFFDHSHLIDVCSANLVWKTFREFFSQLEDENEIRVFETIIEFARQMSIGISAQEAVENMMVGPIKAEYLLALETMVHVIQDANEEEEESLVLFQIFDLIDMITFVLKRCVY